MTDLMWDNGSAPGGAGNTYRGLTHSTSMMAKEGLLMKSTRTCIEPGCQIWTKPGKGSRCQSHARAARIRRLSAQPDLFPWDSLLDENGCWIWTRYLAANGYARIGGDWAHRVAYQVMIGEIPEGLQLDHLCRVAACVNPWHLEPVTAKVNILRSEAPAIVTARDGICAKGHEMTPENVYVRPDTGARHCRECRRHQARIAGQKRKAGTLARTRPSDASKAKAKARKTCAGCGMQKSTAKVARACEASHE